MVVSGFRGLQTNPRIAYSANKIKNSVLRCYYKFIVQKQKTRKAQQFVFFLLPRIGDVCSIVWRTINVCVSEMLRNSPIICICTVIYIYINVKNNSRNKKCTYTRGELVAISTYVFTTCAYIQIIFQAIRCSIRRAAHVNVHKKKSYMYVV